jgi:hypothetical protein
MQLLGARYSVRRATAQRPSPSCAARVGLGVDLIDTAQYYGPGVAHELFREGKRLVTVTGIGGIGKTCLALQLCLSASDLDNVPQAGSGLNFSLDRGSISGTDYEERAR